MGFSIHCPGPVNNRAGTYQIGTRVSVTGNVELIMHRFIVTSALHASLRAAATTIGLPPTTLSTERSWIVEIAPARLIVRSGAHDFAAQYPTRIDPGRRFAT